LQTKQMQQNSTNLIIKIQYHAKLKQ
jgi:hypothetical protein